MLDLINEIMGMGISVHVAMNEMDQIEARNKNVEWVCGQVTVTTSLGYVNQRNLLLKRLMDIAGGLVGCLITAVLTVIIGPMIYAGSPGPIFFSQIRIGENRRKFRLFKFRSMYMDAEKRKQELVAAQGLEDQMMFKMEHDPRIIGQKQRPDGTWKKGIGGIIRDFSLDEFPQFFNVLKGDMSMVGTRPPTVDEWDRYETYHRGRMSTKPGITGLWQISGRMYQNYFFVITSLKGMLEVVIGACTAGIGNSLITESMDKNYRDLRRLSLLFGWLLSISTALMMCIYQPFMTIWMGKENLLPVPYVVCFSVYFYCTGVNRLVNMFKANHRVWSPG